MTPNLNSCCLTIQTEVFLKIAITKWDANLSFIVVRGIFRTNTIDINEYRVSENECGHVLSQADHSSKGDMNIPVTNGEWVKYYVPDQI